MKIIACLDNDNGMMFNHRRQSQDKILRQKLVALTTEKKLWMNHYSASQFDTDFEQIIIDDSFLLKAADGDYCFVENFDIAKYEDREDRIEQIIIFRWNRKYPSDLKFSIPLSGGKWKITQTEDFQGFSHDKITMEIYTK